MNILFVSKLTGTLFSGPTYSVPNQITAQAKYDNVYWLNCAAADYFRKYPVYHDVSEFDKLSLAHLPAPFQRPDLVVFELVYNLVNMPIRNEIRKSGIPYVIVPRSHLTWQGQNRKPLKKKIGNLLIFNQFVRNASAIQYLSKKEEHDSSEKWNLNHFVIPNGINLKSETKASFSKSGIKAVYIGRLEPYQKGIDLLMEACEAIQDTLRENHFILNLYGTSSEKDIEKISDMIRSRHLSDLIYVNQAVFDDEKKKVLLESDIFIMTSRFEGQPMGLLEALSYGLPCLVTEGTYMRQEMDQFQTGWTADTNAESIQQALLNMLKEKNSFAVRSRNALKLADKYNWDSIAQRTHEIYEKLLFSE